MAQVARQPVCEAQEVRVGLSVRVNGDGLVSLRDPVCKQTRPPGEGKPIKNADHWRELDKLLATHQVKFRAVKGHTENERCDELAVAESMKYRNA